MLELSEYEQQFLDNKDSYYWKQRALRAERAVKNERVDELSDRYDLPYTPVLDQGQSITDMMHQIENLSVLAASRIHIEEQQSEREDYQEQEAGKDPV